MAEVINGILPSRSLRREIPYNIVVSKGYYSAPRRRFPVLYLLHGLFGSCNNWIELTRLVRYADLHDLIIVTPEGADSWYADSATIRNDKFESYILKDLIPAVEARFRTRADRTSRGIAGLSMGGYGALKFALKRPDLFGFAASSSGAFNGPILTDESRAEEWEEMKPSIIRAFGTSPSRTRRANDLFRIVQKFDSNKHEAPVVFIDCGKRDSFLDVNRAFSRTLAEYGITHTYKEFSGGHDWVYWNRRLKNILRLADELLG
jgi:putative tributyrin esterase